MNGQCMRMFSGVTRQEFWRFVDDHVINSALHRAEEMVVKMWDMNGLVHHQVVNLAGLWVIIGKGATYCGVCRRAQGRVIALDINRSFIILYNKGITTEHTSVSVRVKFQGGLTSGF